MRGRHTGHTHLKHLAILIASMAAITSLGASAGAHELEDYQQERQHIEDRVRSVLGSPYQYGGESPSGFDCSGLTYWTYLDHGATLPRTSLDQFYLGKKEGYRRIWKRGRLQEGDLVFHKTTSARVGHVGIYVGDGKFISASSGGVKIKSLFDPYYWGPRWVGATRVPATMRD